MDARQQKAFDFVSDYTKQLIALATGIITFTVTFLQDEVKRSAGFSKWILILSWVLFVFSILFGIMRLMALTGNLDPVGTTAKPNLTITSTNVRNPGKYQIITFMVALLLSVVFGVDQLLNAKKKDDKNKTIIILQQTTPPGSHAVVTDTLYPVKPKKQPLKSCHHTR